MKLEDIKCIGIVGAGIMGGGIAQTAILSGFKVIVRDLKDEICENTKDVIINSRFGLKAGVDRGKHTQREMEDAISLLNFTTKVEDLKDCDLIIEAVGGGEDGGIENKPLKLKLFKELDEMIKPGAIFLSNTSGFTIADLAAVTERKNLFIGGHFFSPANIMKLVEVTSTEETDPEVTELIIELAKKWGKVPVRVKDVPGDTGFVGNRIMRACRREAQKIIDEGIATPEDINTVMTLGFRWPVGPVRLGGPSARTGWK